MDIFYYILIVKNHSSSGRISFVGVNLMEDIYSIYVYVAYVVYQNLHPKPPSPAPSLHMYFTYTAVYIVTVS